MQSSKSPPKPNQKDGSDLYQATLKGKINGLEETVKALTEELNFYKSDISNLK